MKTFFGTCVSLFILFAYGSEPSKVQIDRYGQFTHLNFPEKVTSDAQLKADIAADEAYYASFPLPERTFWGGLPGSREKYGLTATGFSIWKKSISSVDGSFLSSRKGISISTSA